MAKRSSRIRRKVKRIVIIAGPNGAGKTTFAQDYLAAEPSLKHFINADLIARGLAPFAPESAAIAAGRIMLDQMRQLERAGESFAFETTLSGRTYARHIRRWRAAGYIVHLMFLSLPSAEMAIARVATRVKQGGHWIKESVIRRRFEAGIRNFEELYRSLVDSWILYNNEGHQPVVIAKGKNR